MKKAFTLIELLIVVAIIAILAAIAVPNFLEAQVRAKVSRVKNDHRSLATAIEAYYVDNNLYPAAAFNSDAARLPSADSIALATGNAGRTFALRRDTGTGANRLSTLTTPVSFITSYFADPFADTRGLPFRYFADRAGWILGSFGPDADQGAGGDLFWNTGTNPQDNEEGPIETVYDSRVAQPSVTLVATAPTLTSGRGAYTYDPTNGTVSQGDVWRTKE